MKPTGFERRMRAGESFHGLRIPPGCYAILRVDGHGFTRFTADRFAKPFDPAFHDHMIAAARELVHRFQALYAYTESDEISLLLPRDWDLYDREVEKVVSLSAGLASSAFTLACGASAHFDGRVWVGARDEDVVDYFRWRQADAGRCALNGWCYWTLRGAGRNKTEATAALHGRPVSFKHDLLFRHGINFARLPAWQRRGTGLYWESVAKLGFDPIRRQPVEAIRRRLKVDRDLPVKAAYDEWLGRILATAA
ncbi:tRNA(His) guanylyltransferase Thg1 family protein [Tundrisphaera sp. TA3]|uniref:tRNA(His) guanylyltransferase Thg1 family protein n=1 Tax=Tundrisphaera sp. TA3 TaxID=3435775 RepID=UPI003EB7AB30